MRYVVILLWICLLPALLFGQRVVSGKSEGKRVKIEPVYEFSKPSRLSVSMRLQDRNEDGLIEAAEPVKLYVYFQNSGEGSAFGIKVERLDTSRNTLICRENIYLSELKAGAERMLVIPLLASEDLRTGIDSLRFSVSEYFGVQPDTSVVYFNSVERLEPDLVCMGVEVLNDAGILRAGETADVKVVLRNLGRSLEGCNYRVSSTDANVLIKYTSEQGKDRLPIGESVSLQFQITSDRQLGVVKDLPVFVAVYSNDVMIRRLRIPLGINEPPVRYAVFPSHPTLENVLRMKTLQDRGMPKSEDILRIPRGKTPNEEAIAIVIGVENYRYLPIAPYACKDAMLMTKYLQYTFGVNRVLTFYDSEVRGDFFEKLFDPVNGKLSKMVKKGKTDVYVYYSGHGVPEKNGEEAYLFPVDGKIMNASSCGYGLSRFYRDLDSLKARNVVVFLDACFMGDTKYSRSYVSRNISGTKGVVVRRIGQAPWHTNRNFFVFTSSRNDQSSLAFDQSGTGLFTYYLALGLKGAADADGDGKITTGELSDYISSRVEEVSRKIRGEQTPQLFGRPDKVLIEYN
ncbi:caspase family protein [Butyricimonas faecalis]|uniref:Peptidase C14 caspase domain-containing protein n=1 Tax=Butyricimonas faecalis TaxID=2093856 RepID=A0A3Q9IL27_9BACT|nr:caspase family protein [Butyricimonas faecalis]AZS28277.1 hypothetical protein D8S85_01065 [Butyricimonas faecalis]